jgi:hypothetical protein
MKLMSENISNISAALLKAQRVMGNATKDSKNPFFKSKYADLNAVREAVLPPLNENGISVIQPTIFHEGKKFVQTMFLHESGEYISGLTEILASKETDAQAQGSGISYARRYGLQSLANIGAEDDDGQAAVGKPNKQERTFHPHEKEIEPTPVQQKTVSTSPSKEVSGDLKQEETKPTTPARRSFRV